MADDEDASLIEDLLNDGFRYESNGRVDGLAIEEEPQPDDEPVPDGDTVDEVGVDDDTGDDAVDVEPDADTGPTEPPSSILAGTSISEEEARGLLHLRQLLINDPELAGKVNRVLSGEPEHTEPPPPPTLPEVIDPEDQTAAFLWGEIQKLTGNVSAVEQQTKQTVEQATQAKIASEINEAVSRFRAAHPSLSEEDVSNVRNHTSANVNITGVMSNFPGDPVEGLTRALEIGSLTDPQTRDKVLAITKETRDAKDEERMKKQSALSGGTGGAARRRPAPKKPPGDWNEVAKRLAEAIENGST